MLKEKSAVEKAIIQGVETLVIGAIAITIIVVLRNPLVDLVLRLTNDPVIFAALLGVVSTSLTAAGAFFVKWLRARQGGLPDYVNE